MFKKSPSRNQRSKGIKARHVLQICLLLGVCFWLIYQVKRSHDKRKEFDENDANASVKAQSDDVILKLGRKDLPHEQEVSKNYKHEEEEEEENGAGDENKHDEEQEEKAKRHEEEKQEGASKHEEEGQEEASKHEEEEQEEEQEEVREDEGSKHDDEEQEAEIKDEEAEDEGRGDGDDEVDENEQEKVDGEADHEEEFLDEEKEREAEGDDKENEEKENEEKEGQEESDNLSDEQNHDGGGRNAQEAREEHYKADDASSAVSHDTHDTQIINSEANKLDMENSNDNSTMNVLEHESKANTTEETNGDENKPELKVDESKLSEGGGSLNETGSSNSEYISLPNTTNTTVFIDQASNNSMEVSNETGNNPAVLNTEIPGSLQNGTSAQHTTEDGLVTEEKYKEQANEAISNNKQPDSNTVDSSKIENVDSATRDSLNSFTDAESGMSEDITKINTTARGDSFGSSMTKEITDSTQNEKSEGNNESGGTDENWDGGQHDPIDSSDNNLPQEEKDARVDLSTLPDIKTEGSNNEEAAAE
ncbi:myb-like protein X [Durio zibethinus]|uniref:Myb-like protein X n=1 Tax=Durio zibethinus TaxID=66656 RepID=A0A6P6ADG5_DURZI|nr:myb-like protein X [Durio zibethinus]XP_022762827.1 myb-like protein X [Durio zibethinus]